MQELDNIITAYISFDKVPIFKKNIRNAKQTETYYSNSANLVCPCSVAMVGLFLSGLTVPFFCFCCQNSNERLHIIAADIFDVPV